MSNLLREPLIMSVMEFRKLTGAATAHMSDEQIEQYIAQLDFIAQLFVEDIKRKGEPMKHEQ